MNRSSGILLHVTSLPGSFGIGDLGTGAYRFVDFLVAAGQGLWQVLPLGPTGYGDSPYQTFSAFAGNPLLISPEQLQRDGWLDEQECKGVDLPTDRVDFGAVIPWKNDLLVRAYRRFQQRADSDQQAEFSEFRREHSAWLEDYALFKALKEHHQGAVWTDWDSALVRREPKALQYWRTQLAEPIDIAVFAQYQFFRQWHALRRYAHAKGVRLIGDVPIFVAHDSADVWAHPEWFYLDAAGQPTVVAGVPPDYFSADGQLWGNPLYRWEILAAEGYSFWVERLRVLLSLVDWVRLDHFRGFAAYWEVPAGHKTALHGHWVQGPGRALFDTLRARLGGLPLIAEDLGMITPDVHALRTELALPGMAILQFAFDIDAQGYGNSLYLPHNHSRDLVVYPGTHDNDTTLGWWRTRAEQERHFIRRYLHTEGEEIHWDLIRTALASVAAMALISLQDVLGLGSEARLNRPGQAGGNWFWRCPSDALPEDLAERLRDLSLLYERRPA